MRSNKGHVLFQPLEGRLLLASVRFAVIGDFGQAGQPEADVANRVKSWMPDLVLTVGDNSYPSGTAALYDPNVGQYYANYIGNYTGSYGPGSATNRFFPTLGNHDWDGAVSGSPTPYTNYFTLPGNERYYDFVSGPVHFFAIDSDSREPDGVTATSAQAQWLQAALAASTSPWNVVYMHHAPYSSSSSHGSTPALQWPFKAWGADVVMAGHDHSYERIVNPTDGLTYFVNGIGGNTGLYGFTTPVAGSKVRFNSDFGAMLVDATDSQINFLTVLRDGKVIDSHTLYASATAPAAPSAAGATVVSYRQVNLAWTDGSANESGFEIERATSGGSLVNIATVAPGVTNYRDVSVSGGTTYQYRVRAINQAGQSNYSTSGSVTTPAAPVPISFIPWNSTWKYKDDGSNQGTAWRALSFNDSAWASGPAQLGYGEDGEATVVSYGPNSSNKYITTYFRRSFNVANPAAIGSINMNLVRDDGVVVYLNGTEIFRQNMGTGTVSYNTLAANASDESTVYSTVISPSLLVPGDNVIAAEIHQTSASSSDIRFNLSLIEAPGIAAPATFTAARVSDSQINLSWGAVASASQYQIDQSTDGITFSPIANPAGGATSLPVTGLAASTHYVFRIRAVNSSGDSAQLTTSASTAPAPPAQTDLHSADDSGASSTDNITRINTVRFIGSAPAGSTVKIYSDGALVGSGIATGGNYSILCSALADGVRSITATVTDTHGNTSTASTPLLVSIDRAGPKVDLIAFNGAASSANIHRLSITFNETVTPAASSLLLHNDTTGADINQAVVSYNFTTRTATWTFPTLPRQMLPDGNYTATLQPTLTDLAGNALDGDSNGTAGDAKVFTFFQLLGDANGDRSVNYADFLLVYNNNNLPSPDLRADFNDDGKVDYKDYTLLQSAYNSTLPIPAPPAPATPLVMPAKTKSIPVLPALKKLLPVTRPTFSARRVR